ncbi:MAG: hypothetical protein A2X36_03985 [Elusimicrobia bacterium GWA2_69_24]|nr:MAG: hypothetical protein A2X36_03985 [Elusimicrobia bacterium GWA2_69_24]
MEYLFNKPGTYRIQAVYDEQALIAPKPTWLESWPEPSRSIVGISLDIFDRFPFSGDARWYGIHAESAILDFEVKE